MKAEMDAKMGRAAMMAQNVGTVAMAMKQYEKPVVRQITAAEVMDRLGIRTHEAALVLLRSDQIPVSRYIQLCDENGWKRGGMSIVREAQWSEEVAGLEAENARLRADLQVLRGIAAAVGDQNWSQGKVIFDAADKLEGRMSKPDEVWRVEVAEARDEIERLRAEVERQDKQNAAFSDTICERDATIADLTAARVGLEGIIGRLHAELGATQAEIERLRAENTAPQRHWSECEKDNDRLRATIADLTEALSAADAAINPPDRGGISLATWNERLKSATEKIRAALAQGG